jgi:hypothetical protein
MKISFLRVAFLLSILVTVVLNTVFSFALDKSSSPSKDNITVVNNVGLNDTVKVAGLVYNDVVKVYNSASGGVLLGGATVYIYGSEVTISIKQIGSAAGSLYITVTNKGKLESDRVKVDFNAEVKSNVLAAENITISNNVGSFDVVSIIGLSPSDRIKVYDAPVGGKTLGAATVSISGDGTKINISQLGTQAGSIYVTVTNTGKLESDRVKVDYNEEPKSDIVNIENISISNNALISDTVKVTGLSLGDIIRVYNSASGGILLGTAKVTSYTYEANVSIKQIGTGPGSIYISLTSKGKIESDRVKADFGSEPKSDGPVLENISVYNNVGAADTIKVIDLTANDIVKVYNDSSKASLLGSVTVGSKGTEAVVTIPQLGIDAGNVYVTITAKGKLESDQIKVDFESEPKTDMVDGQSITIVNNAGMSDTVKVTDLVANDTVKVYNAATKGTCIGSAKVPSKGSEATVNIQQIGTMDGSLYITVTNQGKRESDRVKADFSAEPKSDAPDSNNITIVNNAGMADTVKVGFLSTNDTVKVYNAATKGTLLKSGTIGADTDEITLNISQIGTAEGSLFIAVTSPGKQESDRVRADFIAEPKSDAPDSKNITVVNNAGMSDTIKVGDLTTSDVVKVYNIEVKGTCIGSGTVGSNTDEITLNIPQIGAEAGSLFVSVTSKGKQESDRARVDFIAEPKSDAPDSSNITIVNNAGISDTVKLDGLTSGDIVKVYNLAAKGTLLGTATVGSDTDEATVTISQIGAAGGSIYVTVTNKGKQESGRTKVDFSAEPKSDMLDGQSVTVVNNAVISDIVKVTDLKLNDTIKVYNASVKGTLLGTGTLTGDNTEVTVSIPQIGASAGSIYLSVSNKGKQESDRIKVDFSAEAMSVISKDVNIIATNSTGIADTIKVIGLSPYDVVKAYNAATKGTMLGSATAQAESTEATINIAQLGTGEGSVYVTITSKGKYESNRIKVDYAAESKSDFPLADYIIITNNAVINDTVKVSSVTAGDVIKVYNTDLGGVILGSATASSDNSEITISIKQLGTAAGSVYVTVTNKGKLESDRTRVYYSEESKSDALLANNIYITNNVRAADTVKFTFLNENDIVMIYDSPNGGNMIGSATVPAKSTEVTVNITQLGVTAGNVYCTVTNLGKLESDRIKAYYTDEPKSDAPIASNVYITNNSGLSDIIKVTFLDPEDLCKVYDSVTGNLIGSATVPNNSTEATITIAQLGTNAGNIYVAVTSKGKLESDRTKAYFAEEAKSDAPFIENVYITNYAGLADIVKVTFIDSEDIVKVYDSATGGKILGTATVTEDSKEIAISIRQLGAAAGSVFISVTSWGKLESERIKVDYLAEAVSDAPSTSDITIINNVKRSDTIKVAGTNAYDVVRVYDSAEDGKLLGFATASDISQEVVVNITQLGTEAGYVYISVTSYGKVESDRTKVNFEAETF